MTDATRTSSPSPEVPAGPNPPGGPRLPQILGPGETALWAWRRLRRMSTALVLLFTLTAAAFVATFVPQEPLIRSTVEDWRTGEAGPGAGVARAFDALGLFDVFGSWWFLALVTLLFVSLTGCLVPRWTSFAKTVRRPPALGRGLDRLQNRHAWQVEAAPEAALEVAERELAALRYRTRRVEPDAAPGGRPQLAAERGHWREGGSLVFHSAFYLVLIGAVVGQAFGFMGQVNMVEGHEFAETRVAYNRAEPGRFFDLDDHRGFVLRLDEFSVGYHEGFVPEHFVSSVTVLEGGEEVRSGTASVNHPFVHEGMKFYQARFGMAPRVVVRAGDRVVFDEPVLLSDAGGFVWTGAAKVSLSDPQIALDLVFLPDAAVTDDGIPFSRSPEPLNPRLIAELYVGADLGLQQPVPATQFLRDEDARIDPPAIAAEGGQAPMAAGNLTLEFPELLMWSGFQVSHAPGRWLLLVAAILLLAGLIPSLYSYRRRVWVEAQPSPAGGSRLVAAGVALQRKPAFAEEFADVMDRLQRQLPPQESAS